MQTKCPHCGALNTVPSGDIVYWTPQPCEECQKVSISPKAITKKKTKQLLEEYEVKIRELEARIKTIGRIV